MNERMSDQRFNELLNGPLGHPVPVLHVTRLAVALRTILDDCGQPAIDSLERHCAQRQHQDEEEAKI